MLDPDDLDQIAAIVGADGSRLYQRFLTRFAPAADAHSQRATVAAAAQPDAAEAATAPPLRIRSDAPRRSVLNPARSAGPSAPASPQPPDPEPVRGERAEAVLRRTPRTPDPAGGVATVPSSAVELVSYDDPPPERVGTSANLFLDQYDWLQLTLGRFLAPAVHDHATGKTVYVLPGRNASADGGVEKELGAFDLALSRLQTHLEALIDADPRAAAVLVSLRTLLELRLPPADSRRSIHVRDGSLLFTGWGLEDQRGVRIRDILPADARREYLAALATRLNSPVPEPADAAGANDSPAPPTSRPVAPPERRRPARLTTFDAAPSTGSRLLKGLLLLVLLLLAFVAALLLSQYFWNPA